MSSRIIPVLICLLVLRAASADRTASSASQSIMGIAAAFNLRGGSSYGGVEEEEVAAAVAAAAGTFSAPFFYHGENTSDAGSVLVGDLDVYNIW
jgi:hypothetical protein